MKLVARLEPRRVVLGVPLFRVPFADISRVTLLAVFTDQFEGLEQSSPRQRLAKCQKRAATAKGKEEEARAEIRQSRVCPCAIGKQSMGAS